MMATANPNWIFDTLSIVFLPDVLNKKPVSVIYCQ